MSQVVCRVGAWEVECLPEDGGRISRLCYGDCELLTAAPVAFQVPTADYGAYERRPVYAYDDCLPTVDACLYPDTDWHVPDHGELCWRPWEVALTATGLICRTSSARLPLRFERELVFAGDTLTWRFLTVNTGAEPLVFQHVMHPLMPLSRVTGMRLPSFACCVDATGQGRSIDAGSSVAFADRLLGSRPGDVQMWFLQGTGEGAFSVTFDDAWTLAVHYDYALFPTLAIWWNRDAYPAEAGCRRNECAFEPVPGPCSDLARAHAAGRVLHVEPNRSLAWTVRWTMARH